MFEKSAHAPILHNKLCVSRGKNIVRAISAARYRYFHMDEAAWKRRLREAIEADGRSYGAISGAAGLSRNYLGSVFRDGAEPTVAKVIALCRALDVSPAYIISGADASPETVELMELLDKRPEARAALRALLESQKDAE